MTDWNKFEKCARSVLGKPYKYGAKWPLGDPEPEGPVDCSGFTRWCYSRIGLYIPDGSRDQFLASRPAPYPSLGNLGFFRKNGDIIYHVGILLDTEVIEARGEPYYKVILRPRSKWEAFGGFSGWQIPDIVA